MRRTRYRATIEGKDRPVDILAYSKPGALTIANHYGYKVLELQSAREIAQNAGGYVIDPAALAEAKDFLGLSDSVEIRFNSRVGRVNGNYRHVDTGRVRKHLIMLKSYLSPEQASRTLWHELCHAMQAERDSYAAMQASSRRDGSRYGRRMRYADRPIEVEAREYEQYAEVVPLCVQRHTQP